MPDTPRQPARAPLLVPFALIACATAARIAYHIFLSPFDLTGDEAHYWVWSRHLDLSYYSKGPGIAYLIRAATACLADSEWAIRTVPAIAGAITAIAMTLLARRAAPDSGRAPLFGALAGLLIPAFQGASLLATIDAPFLACWALALLAFDAMDIRARTQRPIALCAIVFGVLVGLGILVKYTMLLLLPGLVIFHLIHPPPARPRTRLTAISLSTLAIAVVASPIAIWNAQRGWPTVHHLLGHLGLAGSDIPRDAAKPWSFHPLYPLEFLATQIALVGPLLILMLLSLRLPLPLGERSKTRRGEMSTSSTTGEGSLSRNRIPLLLICAGLPILLIYLCVSFITEAEGNWPMSAYVSLAVLAAVSAARAFEHRPSNSSLSSDSIRNPQSAIRNLPLIRFLWNASLVYGLIVAAGIPALPSLHTIPAFAKYIPLHRVIGARADAEALAEQLDLMYPTHTRDALVLADRYDKASLLTYYLHRIMGPRQQPLVTSASSLLGDRPSSFDYWPDTDPRNPRLAGHDAILVGSSAEKWNKHLLFDAIDLPYPDAHCKVGFGYRGPRTPDGGGGGGVSP